MQARTGPVLQIRCLRNRGALGCREATAWNAATHLRPRGSVQAGDCADTTFTGELIADAFVACAGRQMRRSSSLPDRLV